MFRTMWVMMCLANAIACSQDKLQEFNVSAIQCQRIAEHVSPRTVEKNPSKFIDSCIQWQGIVATIADADNDGIKAWVIPVAGRFAYVGSTRLDIGYAGKSGTDVSARWGTTYPFDYLCTHIAFEIRQGDPVSFTGKILGVTERPDAGHTGQMIRRVLVAITEIRKLDKRTSFRLPEIRSDPLH